MIDQPPAKRGLSMVFQSYALYPHMSVRNNIGFGLRMAGVDQADRDRRSRRRPRLLNLTPYLDRRPRQLSGGQRQRVAIGRAIVREPKAFLFDEPLSNLDAALRVRCGWRSRSCRRASATTMIYVTHDQVEAMTMADKIVVLNAGKIEQVGSPLELYNTSRQSVRRRLHRLAQDEPAAGRGRAKHGAATIGVRPEHIAASRERGDWQGMVRVAEHLGSDTFLLYRCRGRRPDHRARAGRAALTAGDKVALTPRPDRIHRFDADGTGDRAA